MSTYFSFDEYQTINFLGQNVNVPTTERINYYLEKMDKISEAYKELVNKIKRQVNECKAEGSGAWSKILVNFWMDIYDWEDNGSYVNELLELMVHDGIDVCPNDEAYEKYGEYTSAYQQLKKLKYILVKEAMEIEHAYERSYEMGCNTAFYDAARNIKGMSYGIVTNSAIDMLAYDVISTMTIRSQVKKADEQYMRELGNIAKSTGDIRKSRLLSLMYEHYVPNAMKCVELWVNEITRNIIEYEVKKNNNGVFAQIAKCSIDESQKIIDSIRMEDSEYVVKNKLLNAFKLCPYNKSVYQKIVQLGMLNYELFQFALYLNGDIFNAINAEVENTCSRNLENISFIKQCISFKLVHQKEEEVLKEIYKPHVDKIRSKYNYMKEFIEQKKSIKKFVRDDLGISSIEKFVNITDENINDMVKCYVEAIVSKKLWDILIENSFIEIEDFSVVSSEEWDCFNGGYINAILDRVKEYIEIMKVAYRKYEDELVEYEKRCNLYVEELNKMEDELKTMSFWKMKKKKNLKEELEAKKMESYDFAKDNKPKIVWM